MALGVVGTETAPGLGAVYTSYGERVIMERQR